MARDVNDIFSELAAVTGIDQAVIDKAMGALIKHNPTVLINPAKLDSGSYVVQIGREGVVLSAVKVLTSVVDMTDVINAKPLAGALRQLSFDIAEGNVENASILTRKPGAGRKPSADKASK